MHGGGYPCDGILNGEISALSALQGSTQWLYDYMDGARKFSALNRSGT